jgi:hypothetical protein
MPSVLQRSLTSVRVCGSQQVVVHCVDLIGQTHNERLKLMVACGARSLATWR